MERCQKWFHFAAVVRGLKEERNDRLRECEMEMYPYLCVTCCGMPLCAAGRECWQP